MKKNLKLLILLLSITLVIGAFAIAASAAEESSAVAKIGDTEYETLAAALAGSKSGDKIVLINDATSSATFKLSHDLTIDLNGKTLTIDTSSMINIQTNISFNVIGEGKIIMNKGLIYAGNYIAPTVRVESFGAPMEFESTNGAGIVNVASGNYVLSNLKVKADMSAAAENAAIFRTGGNGVDASFEINGVTVNATGIPMSSGNSLAVSVVRLISNATATLNYCNMRADNTIVQVNAGTAGKNVLTVNNCYLYSNRAYSNNISGNRTGVIGNGTSLAGNIVINNSQIVGSYKPINVATNGTGTVYINNSTVKHNGTNGNGLTVDGLLRVDGDSSLGLSPTETPASKLMDAVNGAIILEAGARVNQLVYDIITSGGVKVSEKTLGEDGSVTEALVDYAESAYELVYDPVGDTAYPYVLVSKSAAENAGVDKIDGKIFYADGSSLPTKNFYSNGFVSSVECTDALKPTVVWNPSGTMAGYSFDNGNIAFKYTKNTTSKGTNIITGLTTGIKQSAMDVMVIDFDFATSSSKGYPAMGISLHSRSSSNPSSGSNTNRSLVKIASDGFVTSNFTNAKNFTPYQLSTQKWNHFTIVVDTSVENTGIVYVFINGVFVGSGDAYQNDNAYISGPRFDITASNVADYNFLLDNLLIRKFGDGTSTTAITNPESYLLDGGAAWNSQVINENFVPTIDAGSIEITNINDLVYTEDENGILSTNIIPHLNRNHTSPYPVNNNVKIALDGKTFNFPSGSTAFDTVYAADGTKTAYEFNKAYEDAKVTFKWFIGNINQPEDLEDESLWVTYESRSGIIPSSLYSKNNSTPKLLSKGYNYSFAKVNGWDFPVANHYDYTFALKNSTVEIKPTFDEANPTDMGYTYAVLDANGNFDRGGNTTTLYGSGWYKLDTATGKESGVQLKYGETFVFLSDSLTLVGAFKSGSTGTESDNKTFSFDFNGHSIIADASKNNTGKRPGIFNANPGETVNVYSSIAGATIKYYGLNGDSYTDPMAGYFMSVWGKNCTKLNDKEETVTDIDALLNRINTEETDKITVNIGTATNLGEKHSGKNLTIYGDCLVRLTRGDKSCTVNVTDVTFVKTTSKATIFVCESYSGALNVKGSTFLASCHNNFISSTTSSAYKSDDLRALCKAFIEDCTVIMSKNTVTKDNYDPDDENDNRVSLVGNNHGFESITFKNVVTNGRINPSNVGKVVTADENVYSPFIDVGCASGLVSARYNKPMTFGSITDADTYTIYVLEYDAENKKFVETPFVIAAYGTDAESADLVLPLLTHKTVRAEDAVTLTFVGLDGKVVRKEAYVKGSSVLETAPENATLKGKVVTLTQTGWDSTPEVMNENVTVNPIYNVEKSISGVRANLSLYTDFNVNLYLPLSFEDVLVSVNNGELTYEKVDTDKDGEKDSLKLVIELGCTEATTAAVFNLAFKEFGEEVTATYSISIAAYAKAIVDGDFTAEDDKLMYYMIAYAAEACKYFGEENAELTELLTYIEDAKGEGTVDHEFANAIEELNFGGVFEEATIKLDSAPAFVLTLKDGFAGTVTVQYGLNVKEYTVSETDSRTIVIEGMKVYNFGATLTINAEGTIGETDVKTENAKYNLDTFVNYHVENAASDSDTAAASEKCLAVLLALYDYVCVADEYTK